MSAKIDKTTQPTVIDVEERTWLPRYCRGEHACFRHLMGAYQAPIYTYLKRCGLDHATCDDLFQDVFLKVHIAAASYHASRPLRPWLFTIVINTVRNHFRGRRENTSNDIDIIATISNNPEDLAVQRQTLHWLQHAMLQLPDPQYEILLLATIQELKQQDIAEIMQIPLNTVKTHLRRARASLAKQLGDRHDAM